MCADRERVTGIPAQGGHGRMLSVQYMGRITLRVQGPVSGRLYHFSVETPNQSVDERDLPSLLETRLFREIGNA